MKLKNLCLAAFAALSLIACTEKELMRTVEQATDALGGGSGTSGLSTEEVVAGLREALSVGTNNATGIVSKANGFLGNPKIRIPFPEEAIKVKQVALDLGLGNQVNQFETTLNRSAEEAAKSAAPIFLNAIKGMSIQDGFAILKGEKNAATNFLKNATYNQLYAQFKPRVETAVTKMKVGEYWKPLSNAYNTATLLTGGQQVDPDLNDYVTTRAVDGLFVMLAEEEAKIRLDPMARVSDLLKKVFGSQG